MLERTIATPRKGASAPTDADDRFDDSRHPRRTLASNGSRSSGARVSSERNRRRLGRSLLAQSARGTTAAGGGTYLCNTGFVASEVTLPRIVSMKVGRLSSPLCQIFFDTTVVTWPGERGGVKRLSKVT